MNQRNLLHLLTDKGPMKRQQIADHFGIGQSRVSWVMKTCRQSGYLDGLQITDAGKAFIDSPAPISKARPPATPDTPTTAPIPTPDRLGSW